MQAQVDLRRDIDSARTTDQAALVRLFFGKDAGPGLCSSSPVPYVRIEELSELRVSVLFTPSSKPGVSPQQFESFPGQLGAFAGGFNYFKAAPLLGRPDLSPNGSEWLFEAPSGFVDGTGLHDGFQYTESARAYNQFALVIFYPNFGTDSEQHLKPSLLVWRFVANLSKQGHEDIESAEIE